MEERGAFYGTYEFFTVVLESQTFIFVTPCQGKEEEFGSVYQSLRGKLSSTAHVSVARVLAARQDLLSIEKTSSGATRMAAECAINKVVIGKASSRSVETDGDI